MTQFSVPNGPDLACYKSDGTPLFARKAETGGTGVVLASGSTYYFPLNIEGASLESVHLRGDAVIIITAARIEDTNMPNRASAKGDVDVSVFDATAGNWIIENPATAYVATAGAGWTATAATLAVAGGTAGGAIWHLGNMGTTRSRLAIVVGGTGGVVRVCGHSKGM